MQRLALRALSVLVITVLLATAVAGCLAPKPAPSPTRKPPPDIKFYANQAEGWQNLTGTFQLYILESNMEYWAKGGDAWQPIKPRCHWIQLWNWDGTYLSATNRHALHPTDPGPLTAVWIHTIKAGPECPEQGFFGINEDPMERRLSLVQRELPNGTNPDLVRLFVKFDRTNTTPAQHTVTVNGQVFGPNQGGYAVWQTEDPANPGDFYRMRTHVEFAGDIPLANIYRFD